MKSLKALSRDELSTLSAIADPSCTSKISRSHLEKLSRLELIEPTCIGVTISLRGKEILFSSH